MDQVADFMSKLQFSPMDLFPKKVELKNKTAKEIMEDVCDFLATPLEDIAGKLRFREKVKYRYLIMYALYRYTQSSFKKIGQLVGNRDHTTVIHGLRTVKDMMDTQDPEYLELFTDYFRDRDTKYRKAQRLIRTEYQCNF